MSPPRGAATSVPLESSLGTGRVDVAAISFHDATVRLGADDGTGQQRDPESLVYTGAGGLGYLVFAGVLLFAGGAAVLVLYRRRKRSA